MDAYSGYNQIWMLPVDDKKTTFIIESVNYYYKVTPFGLKNVRATYQRLINKIFSSQIGRIMQVYVDDMVAKTTENGEHCEDLEKIFMQVRKYNMHLNPKKCAF